MFVAPYLCLVCEASAPLTPSERFSIAEVEEFRVGRGGERSHGRLAEVPGGSLVIAVPDGWMSSKHVRGWKDAEGWSLEDLGSKNGVYVNGARVTEHRLADEDVIEIGSTIFLFRDRIERDFREPPDAAIASAMGPAGIITTLSLPFARELADLRKIAAGDAPVVLHGETGTGKEVTARAIHSISRRSGAFVAVNCGALPSHLIESELFGHKRGAFSGAVEDHPGLIRAADRGTLFLDEVAELPEAAQATLLRALQEREVTPVGATRPVSVDFRVVAATHQDLEERIEQGRFRADLFARLSGFTLELPALRERREDLGVLIGTLLRRLTPSGGDGFTLDRSAASALIRYDWPLNVRELEQALRAAVSLATGGKIALEHLPDRIATAPSESVARPRVMSGDLDIRRRLEAAMIEHRGNISAVARALGKARVQIRRWCKRFDIDPDSYR